LSLKSGSETVRGELHLPLPDESMPVMERAYWVIVSLLYETGSSGLADLKTARIAERASTTESTILRQAKTRDRLVAQAIDWCWHIVNERLAEAAYANPLIDSDAKSVILADMENLLGMFDDPHDRVWVTGALLGYRPTALTAENDNSECSKFMSRLQLLCSRLDSDGDAIGTDLLAPFLVKSIDSAWFIWLLRPDLVEGNSPINKRFILDGIRRYLHDYTNQVKTAHGHD
jgi:AcrR family transcriptional regulator